MKIALVTDSTADLPKDTLDQYDIHVIPAILVIEGQEYADGKGITREEFYRQLPDLNPPATTAAPAPGIYQQIYQDLFDAGYQQIISIHAASELSGLYNTAKLVAASFQGRVHPVDSQQLSMGIGFQVIEAAEMLAAGADVTATLAHIDSIRPRIRLVAMLDTLEQLRRSGRVSWARAGLGTLLRIKPFIELKDGRVHRLGDARTRQKGIARLRAKLTGLGKFDRLAILHTNAEFDAQFMLDSLSLSLSLPHTPFIINVTPVIGNHLGANGLGFCVILAE
jgi:DegV family protein with EDD domain